ncbi:hypothetical protein [Streptomyces sp. NBC_00996]|uniref:hypothetical protein n=1 Tax=Streptomyces sp. NBC_00996 TaxID=2903710 RepID=UPI003870263C|nr:hypothetical protein OG390_45285 [Streptomyces sp. NBC_00996]
MVLVDMGDDEQVDQAVEPGQGRFDERIRTRATAVDEDPAYEAVVAVLQEQAVAVLAGHHGEPDHCGLPGGPVWRSPVSSCHGDLVRPSVRDSHGGLPCRASWRRSVQRDDHERLTRVDAPRQTARQIEPVHALRVVGELGKPVDEAAQPQGEDRHSAVEGLDQRVARRLPLLFGVL